MDDILYQVWKLRGFTEDDVKRVVESNDKKRFSLEREGERLKIRANQGHSIEVVSSFFLYVYFLWKSLNFLGQSSFIRKRLKSFG